MYKYIYKYTDFSVGTSNYLEHVSVCVCMHVYKTCTCVLAILYAAYNSYNKSFAS